MAIKKDTNYWAVTDISIILSYLLCANVTATNTYIALSQIGMASKDLQNDVWKPTEEGLKFAQERPYIDKRTGEEKIFFVWHRDVIEKLKKYFEEVKNGGKK